MKYPFNIFERMEYKREYIKRFGKDRYKSDHEGKPRIVVGSDGKRKVVVDPPMMPMDVAKWLREMDWPLNIYIQTAVRETNDIGSNVHYNTLATKATAANTVDAVQSGTKKLFRLALFAGIIVVLVIYRKQIKSFWKRVGA